jgi:hypothetical protein
LGFGSVKTKNPATFREQGGINFGLNYSSRCPQIRHARVTNGLVITTKRCGKDATITGRMTAAPARDIWLQINITGKHYYEMAVCQQMKFE